MTRPIELFGREEEWESLTSFVERKGSGASVAMVYGRRRQGKTMLLEALCEAADGLLWQAREQSASQNLRSLELAIGVFTGVTPRLESWDAAIEMLCELQRPNGAHELPLPIVLDEVGYLLDADPGFASRLQAALAPLRNRRRKSAVRLVLCGSAFGQMRRLVDAGAPLRGRSQLDLVLRPFRFREAAEFWGLDNNPDLAFRLHALVGGTPAYREFAGGATPTKGDLDRWVIDQLLSVSSPLMNEGRTVVAEDPALHDRALYWAVLGAVADGATSRGDITKALGRPPTALHHALTALIEAGWLHVDQDPLRERSSRYSLGEPIVRFHRLVVEPAAARLTQRRKAAAVWAEAIVTVRSQIYAPHLEQVAREWVMTDADERTTGGPLTKCGPSRVGTGKRVFALDLLATVADPRGVEKVSVVGEVKSGQERTGVDQLDRLDAAMLLLDPKRVSAPPKRLLVARSGFTRELEQRARTRPDVELVDLQRLYNGD
jgi:uncharacterized protein